jgi:hypothetical protein
MARHDATTNQATIASFRIVAAEAGGVAATGAETAGAAASGHHGWLKQADSRQCEHGYDRFPHRVSLLLSPHWSTTLSRPDYAAVEHLSRVN